MARWNTDDWDALCDGNSCPICLQGKPHHVVAELKASFVTCQSNGPMRGYCCVVSKRHVVELHDLTVHEGAFFMDDVQRTSRAISELTAAVKMNYEIHGNTIPHLHLHIFPRYRGDPFEGRPIDPSLVQSSPYAEGEFDQFVLMLKDHLQRR